MKRYMRTPLDEAVDTLENLLSDVQALRTREDSEVALMRMESWFSVIRARRIINERVKARTDELVPS